MDPDRARELLAGERARIERTLAGLVRRDTGEPADAVAAAVPAFVLRTGRTTRLGGVVLLFAYSLLVVCFYLSGDR